MPAAVAAADTRDAHPALAALDALLARETAVLGAAADRAAKRPCLRKTEYEEQPEALAQRMPGRQNLERFERAFQYLFTHGGVRLGYLQQRFLHAARLVLLRRMFGDAELVAYWPELRDRFKIARLYTAGAIVFPRRSGKTTVQTLLAAVVAVSQPDGNVCCFNLTGPGSMALSGLCTSEWCRSRAPEQVVAAAGGPVARTL